MKTKDFHVQRMVISISSNMPDKDSLLRFIETNCDHILPAIRHNSTYEEILELIFDQISIPELDAILARTVYFKQRDAASSESLVGGLQPEVSEQRNGSTGMYLPTTSSVGQVEPVLRSAQHILRGPMSMDAPISTSVDFLLLAPLDEERAALLAHLPQAKRLPPDDQDVRVYYQADVPTEFPDGEQGSYRAIITSPLGIGRAEAALVTSDAIRRWQPRYVLLVGIAGGVSEEVDLGDVLVAEQFADYEQQKITGAGAQVRYQIFRSDARLYGAAKHLRGWKSSIRELRPVAGEPRCHFGVVISGDKVQSAPDSLKPYLSDWPKLIGVEMEVGGAAAAAWEAPSKPGILMVRGVSDLADENKGSSRVKMWRPYACDVAAAYAVALLRSGIVPLAQLHQSALRARST